MANYGAIDDDREQGFDGRYLDEPKLTREQKIRKFTLVAVPILLAILIVGGAALFLSRDFDSLYPGHHGSGSKEPSWHTTHTTTSGSSTYSERSEPLETTTSTTAPSDTKSGSSGASGCLAHEKCTGLTGECCPTTDGKFLSCCN